MAGPSPFRAGMAFARPVRGQAMVEYLIVLPVLLLLVMGGIQFALLYQVKTTLNYAAFVGARQGALKNAQMTAIKDGVAAGMTPMFTFDPSLTGLMKGRLIATVEVFNPLFTKIEILNPTPSAFTDFGGAPSDPSVGGSIKEIPNDSLMYRGSGAGASSGMSLQDANILKIRVTYCAKLIVPLVNRIIYGMSNGVAPAIADSAAYLRPVFSDVELGTASSGVTTGNMCTRIGDTIASNQTVQDASAFLSGFGINISGLTNAITDAAIYVSSLTIPGIDWTVGGLRIPVTAEAVVHMHSPPRGEPSS